MYTSPYNELLSEAEGIQAFLEITCSEQPEEIKERLITLSVYCARSGNMLAQAKRILNQKTNRGIMNLIKKHSKDAFLSAKIQNALIDSLCPDENYLVDQLERINRSTVHQIDVLRSLLSYEKEQIRNSPNLT